MSLPLIAIVGRPNVGKSSLLNRLAGRRVSIVEPTAGVTRDRVIVAVEALGRRFEVMDTGGLGLVDEDRLKEHIESQIEVALESCDGVLFVVDAKEGLVPGDELVARRLRKLGRPVALVVNKVESRTEELGVHEWQRLGFGEPLPTSALEGFGTTDVLQRVVSELLPPERRAEEDQPADEAVLKFAVVGKRNSGKSTLINHLAGAERVIVSEIPGTTRDAIDVVFDVTLESGPRRLMAIDTAGVRKRSRLQDAIELFSYTRATESIRRADVVLHLFDVREEISQVDKKVAHYYSLHHKPVVIVGNKIDLVPDLDLEKWDRYIRQQLSGLRFAPVAFVSAKDGFNVVETLDLLVDLHEQAGRRIGTAELNDALQDAKTRLSPKSRSKVPRLYYGTQIDVRPPTILVFVNDPKLFRGQYERYLSNILRERFDLPEVPIKLIFRERTRARPGEAPQDARPV
ncbi:MAG: ribosome biogenesis GTPase Der [Planctomycetes bacterium]|nr:ribosome biogenesis GTPase Der [Planctomycetota bacterium]